MHLVVGIFSLVAELLWLFSWALILSAVISTLISFGVLNTRNRFVWMISDFLYRVTEPVVRPIRAVLPNLGGIDLSPLIVLLLIQYVLLPLLSDLEGVVLGSMAGQS